MNAVEQLRAFAKARGLRLLRRTMYTPNVPETLTAQVKLTVADQRLTIWASDSYFQVDVQVTTRLVFSVGSPNKIVFLGAFAVAPGAAVPLYIFRPTSPNEGIATVGEVERWMGESMNRQMLVNLMSDSQDATVHVTNNVTSVIERGGQLDDARLTRIVTLSHALATVAPAPSAPLDVSMLPPKLAAFVRQFEGLAQGDDELRQELRQHIPTRQRVLLLREASQLFTDLNSYLGALAGPWPEAAHKLSQLGELVSELMLEQSDVVRQGAAPPKSH